MPDGTAVAVKRLTTTGRDQDAQLDRLQGLGDLRNANLLDVLTVFQEDGHLWVASRLDDGVRLSQLLELGRLPPACAVAVGIAVLDALTSLHQVGVCHGAVHGRNVHVGRDGTVRLGDYALAVEPGGVSTAVLRAADVRAAGALLASSLGVVLRHEGGSRPGRAGRPESALGLAVRAITGSPRLLPAGREAAHASLTLRESARAMATPQRRELARARLAAMVAEIIKGCVLPPHRP
jgi:serine/threonine protein kinase